MSAVAEARIDESYGPRVRRAYAAELVECYLIDGDLANARESMGWLMSMTKGSRLRARVGIMRCRIRSRAADATRALGDLDQLLAESGIA